MRTRSSRPHRTVLMSGTMTVRLGLAASHPQGRGRRGVRGDGRSGTDVKPSAPRDEWLWRVASRAVGCGWNDSAHAGSSGALTMRS